MMQAVAVTDKSPVVGAWGTWECAGARGTIRETAGGGYVGESAAVIAGETAATRATPEDAAREAYRREAVLAPVLGDILARYRIEHPQEDTARVYAVTGNDPRAEADGEPGEGARYANLAPWEREAVKVARANARLAVVLATGDGDTETVTRAAVAGRHVVIVRYENGAETGRWRVLDGSRKVALFLS